MIDVCPIYLCFHFIYPWLFCMFMILMMSCSHPKNGWEQCNQLDTFNCLIIMILISLLSTRLAIFYKPFIFHEKSVFNCNSYHSFTLYNRLRISVQMKFIVIINPLYNTIVRVWIKRAEMQLSKQLIPALDQHQWWKHYKDKEKSSMTTHWLSTILSSTRRRFTWQWEPSPSGPTRSRIE